MPVAVELPHEQVQELLKTLVKGFRAFQMYLPNNPVYQRAIENVRAAFQPVWGSGLDKLVLTVVETDIVWEERVVYHQPSKSESFAWFLFKDGMRVLTLFPGVEADEIIRFLEIVQRARALATDAGDDLLTLLWAQDFTLVQYHFAEFAGDASGFTAEERHGGTGAADAPQPTAAETRGKVEEEAPPKKSGIMDLEDFDSTLYWLDEAEIRKISDAVEKEYQQDLRANTIAILFDIFEQREEDWARGDVLSTLEAYLPHVLSTGDFKTVGTILRETRLIVGRNQALKPEQRERLDAFVGRLSDPGVLAQILQSIDEATSPPREEDLGEVFRELRPAALETILIWLPRLSSPKIHALLESAAERLAETSPAEVLRLLRQGESEALVAVIGLCGRLKLQASVPGLGDTLGHADPAVRLASVQALSAVSTPGALGHIERGVDDADREVRLAAVQEMGRRGFKGALRRIEPVVQGKQQREIDLTERMRFFEAYALIARDGALETLSGLLSPGALFRRKESPEVRACAALAIGKIRTAESRALLERTASDKDLVVRNAVSRALRENPA
jgi:HEAT repeat protein